ncbi:hypothetical protein N473_12670 [Pseudoalteromonas luteoviolacea CPMOR-1]|uniref:DUF3703 domain-containing protein n=1 Tax=Pseudoalteromonas luteoviolacea CPMOR-1 TaxID=1365248 RepID=A0A167LWF1_9GAMM|nr:DUF3703 domain-containing protein [Pseudoalteromonas luteoviolacea]KZN65380.1 hypothetical protein N473_12670 [Pseudoalteromonas luteoviolacea CPMOR-1]
MNSAQKHAYERELMMAKTLYHNAHYTACFGHLERAHILGQRSIFKHTTVHWWMLKVGVKFVDKKAVLGQVMRLIASIIFSRIWVPVGNTGGTNVNAFKSMPIPQDLKKYLE